ncbi:MAG: hypothetical protein MUQ10_08440 [Anaerolineae bacterium]|nr:hypothetical protein [Anaerolineae bacterium]
MGQQLSPDEKDRLIGLQIRLEYRFDRAGRLHPFEGSSEQARFIVYRHPAGIVKFVRYDLPPAQAVQLHALPPELAFEGHDAVSAILGNCNVGVFHSCVFVALPPLSGAPDVVQDEDGCFVVRVGGMPVSWGWSSRENEDAAELAVETNEHHRRRGFGRQVATVWAHDRMIACKVALYSYEEGNFASARLARSLGVVEYAVVTAYE